MNTPDIELLFPTVVMLNTMERSFTKSELAFVAKHGKKDRTVKNTGNFTSTNNYILDEPEFRELKELITQQLNAYIQIVLKPKDKIEGYVTQSWLNYTSKGEYHHPHSHPNSIISGCLYLSADATTDKIKFHKTGYQQIELASDKFDTMNSDSWWFSIKTGGFILFPSSLMHEVEYVESDKTRISIAFNSFVKGTLGENNSLTELVL